MTEDDKRARILEAARALILKQGLRATTMEAIAAVAQVAKPTLYRYYRDKGALFTELVTELVLELHADFDSVLQADGPIEARIAAALTLRYQRLSDTLANSPFAEELLGEGDRMVQAQMKVADEAANAALHRLVVEAGVPNPDLSTDVLLAACYGLFRKNRPGTDLGPAIRLLVGRLLRSGGVEAQGPSPQLR